MGAKRESGRISDDKDKSDVVGSGSCDQDPAGGAGQRRRTGDEVMRVMKGVPGRFDWRRRTTLINGRAESN